jgi:glycogen(starch) synthase
MTVAIFASAFYPSLGGVEELVRQLAHEYRRQGFKTIVLVNRWPRSLPAAEVIEDIPVYRLPMRMPEFNLRVRTNYAVGFPWTRTRMLGILRQHNVDLIHVQCVSVNGHYASIAARALGLPLVVTSQGERTMDSERVYEKSPFLNATLRKLLAEADRITACSQNTLTDLETWCQTSFADRAAVIHNGIRLADFDGAQPYPHPRPYILAIGRMVLQKGFDLLLQAFAASGLASHDLLLAGDGPERPNLERLAQSLRMEGRVRFLGRADRGTAVALFCGCDFFVLPSRREPMGIVNLEAMAAGKAVIASRTGGVSEVVVDGETALLLPPDDVPALSAAICRLAADPRLRERLGAAGLVRVRQFTWEAVAAAYRQTYELALSARRAPQSELIPAPVPVWTPE